MKVSEKPYLDALRNRTEKELSSLLQDFEFIYKNDPSSEFCKTVIEEIKALLNII